MATIDTLPDRAGAKLPSPAQPTWLRSNWGLLLAVAALVMCCCCRRRKAFRSRATACWRSSPLRSSSG